MFLKFVVILSVRHLVLWLFYNACLILIMKPVVLCNYYECWHCSWTKSLFWYQLFIVGLISSLLFWETYQCLEVKSSVFLWITLAVPAEVDSYHSLFPLEPLPPPNRIQKSSNFGYITSCYKAVNSKDDLPYCLRRIHGKEDKLSFFRSILLRLRFFRHSWIYLLNIWI